MLSELPQTPRQLRRTLALRLALAALLVGALSASASWLLEARRAEQAALEQTADGVRHFESPAMRIAADPTPSGDHQSLYRLLDRKHLIGIRVFDMQSELRFEAWDEAPDALVAAARSLAPAGPPAGRTGQAWIDVGDERLIHTLTMLRAADGKPVGRLEGFSRIDAVALRAQRDQARNGAITAAIAVALTALLLYPLLLALVRRMGALSCRLLDANLSLLTALGNATARRDSETDAHNYRVTLLAVALAEDMPLGHGEIAGLVLGAFLHDVGKIGIPDAILLKPGKLDAAEFAVMKTHCRLGAEIVAGNRWLDGAMPVILHHHERFDGRGYPNGLRGDGIPLAARIFAVADVFDALTSRRPYKEALPVATALRLIEDESGTHFDPRPVAALGRVLATRPGGAEIDAEAARAALHAVLRRYFNAGPGSCAPPASLPRP